MPASELIPTCEPGTPKPIRSISPSTTRCESWKAPGTGLAQQGVTRDGLKAMLMQTAIDAGVPAASTAFAEAGRIIADLDRSDDPA